MNWMNYWASSKRPNKLSKIAPYIERQSLTPVENAAIIAALLNEEVKEKKLARQVVWLQILAILTGASIAYGIKGVPQLALALLSGGAISVVNGAMLAWRMSRSVLQSAQNVQGSRVAHQQLRLMYFYAAERFLVVIVLLCLFMATMKLSPLALLGGFAMGQATLIVARLFLNYKVKTEILTKNVQ
jgi:ATP synthase protein I